MRGKQLLGSLVLNQVCFIVTVLGFLEFRPKVYSIGEVAVLRVV